MLRPEGTVLIAHKTLVYVLLLVPICKKTQFKIFTLPPDRPTLVPIVDFTAKNSQSLVILILLIKIMNYHVFLHLLVIYMILKGYR